MKRKIRPHKMPRYLRNKFTKRRAYTAVDYLRDSIRSPSFMHQFFKVEPVAAA